MDILSNVLLRDFSGVPNGVALQIPTTNVANIFQYSDTLNIGNGANYISLQNSFISLYHYVDINITANNPFVPISDISLFANNTITLNGTNEINLDSIDIKSNSTNIEITASSNATIAAPIIFLDGSSGNIDLLSVNSTITADYLSMSAEAEFRIWRQAGGYDYKIDPSTNSITENTDYSYEYSSSSDYNITTDANYNLEATNIFITTNYYGNVLINQVNDFSAYAEDPSIYPDQTGAISANPDSNQLINRKTSPYLTFSGITSTYDTAIVFSKIPSLLRQGDVIVQPSSISLLATNSSSVSSIGLQTNDPYDITNNITTYIPSYNSIRCRISLNTNASMLINSAIELLLGEMTTNRSRIVLGKDYGDNNRIIIQTSDSYLDNDLIMSPDYFYITSKRISNIHDSMRFGYTYVSNSIILQYRDNSGMPWEMTISPTAAIIKDDINSVGLRYYSSSYSSLSDTWIPHKKYVDDRVITIKNTTGDPPSGDFEGQTVLNTADNTYKIWAEGAWRTILTY